MKETLIEMFQPIVLTLATALVGMVAAYIRKKLKTERQKDILDEIEQCLLEGMAQAQEQLVRPAKKDGKKLDEATISAAEEMAVKFAKQAAKGAVSKKLDSMSNSRLKSMIKQLL